MEEWKSFPHSGWRKLCMAKFPPHTFQSKAHRGFLSLFFFFFPPKVKFGKKKKRKKALLDSFQLMLHVVTRRVKLHLLCWKRNIRETLWREESQHEWTAGTLKAQHGSVVSNPSPGRDEVFQLHSIHVSSLMAFPPCSRPNPATSIGENLVVTRKCQSQGKFCPSADPRIRPGRFSRLWSRK